MLHIGRARQPGPRRPLNGHTSIECIDVGGWLSNEDLALDCEANFLAVVEHRLITDRTRAVAASLKNLGLGTSLSE